MFSFEVPYVIIMKVVVIWDIGGIILNSGNYDRKDKSSTIFFRITVIIVVLCLLGCILLNYILYQKINELSNSIDDLRSDYITIEQK